MNTSNLELVVRIIALRGWRNGSLTDLCAKALLGHEITRADTDLTEKQWNTLTQKG